jgi:tripartite-type tricarboxylate transporter receptor subunit TctC
VRTATSQQVGQPVLVENKTGAGGIIAPQAEKMRAAARR